jgi:diguanylate cyclase (GGDEF)-like protein
MPDQLQPHPLGPPDGALPTDDDDLLFVEETQDHAAGPDKVWRVMIIDDDRDVHLATTMALNHLEIQKRPLSFLHAYSAMESRELLAQEADIAVILLDVVMETQDAGLQLVRYIRETLTNTDVRIVLRTGQPGYAVEIDAIRLFDINDYKNKSELTRTTLFTTMTAAIRSFEQIKSINASRRGLNLIVRGSAELMALHGLHNFASAVITQIANLIGLPPHGLICSRNGTADHDQPNMVVVAGLGDYADATHQTVTSLGNPRIEEAIAECMRQRANIYTATDLTLFFLSKSGQNLVAYIDTKAALDAIDHQLVDVFCSNIAVGMDNVELVTNLHNFAFYDPLSKLPNRTRLAEILNITLASPGKGSSTLALIDIDHFSDTNEVWGHKLGDQLLLAVVDRLRTELSAGLVIARVGSDIFAVLGDDAHIKPHHILELFQIPFVIEGQGMPLSATIGLVQLGDYQGEVVDAFKDASIALKHAKTHQRKGHFYYSHRMGLEIRERVHLMHALRTALELDRLHVVYQPQVDLATRRVVGAEALLRWKSEDGSFISPERFIPIAEYSGMIVEIGAWILRRACHELVHLRQLGHTDFRMSINVSQAQFRHPLFLQMLNDALTDTQAPPQFVELEITESMAMEEPQLLIAQLAAIKLRGVSIAIDDFGTGFSSLSYLQRLQVDRLKIDRSFVNEITDSERGGSIAELVIQLGAKLGLSVIAEGVENARQVQILTDLGCELVQGFFFAHPMSASQLEHWLSHDAPQLIGPA